MRHVAIAGVGEAPHGKYPERSPFGTALSVAHQAILDAHLEHEQIGGVLTAPAFGHADLNMDLSFGRLTRELGIAGKARFSFQVNQGGTTGADLLRAATGLIESGAVDHVLCLHSDNFSLLTPTQVFKFFATAGFNREFETPLGMTYNTIPGLTAHRYMHETGARAEHMAAVAVSHRRWAELNPNAAYRKPLTIEEVLASPVPQSPLHNFEIPMSVDGASAFVVSAADIAERLVDRPAYVHADASRVNTWSFTQYEDFTRMNWAPVAKAAYAAAGITPAMVNIAQIYMAYPIFDLISLEELGLVERGGAGEFVLSGETSPGGSMPMTTNGGATSAGHTGAGVGVSMIVEAARQVMGKAGERQQQNVEFVVETNAGGSYMDANVTIYGAEKPMSRKGQ